METFLEGVAMTKILFWVEIVGVHIVIFLKSNINSDSH